MEGTTLFCWALRYDLRRNPQADWLSLLMAIAGVDPAPL
jgi:hypothetical protein